jgi:hypothetical protein
MMTAARLEPGSLYWASANNSTSRAPVVVQVSTLFGDGEEYWTLVLPGSEQHHMPSDFTIIEKIVAPVPRAMRQAAE